MRKLNKHILLLFIFLTPVALFAQSREELERKRKQKEKEIELTKKLISETTEKQKESLAFLNTLNSQINSREELISTIRKEIKYLDEQIVESHDVVDALERDLGSLKKEYASMVRFAYKNRNTYNKIGFILSAETFNQSFKRLKLLQNYSAYRKKQMKLILETKDAIQRRLTSLNRKKDQKKVNDV